MASNDIQATLQREVSGVIAMLGSEGRNVAIRHEDAARLFDTARELATRLRTGEREQLLIQTSLIWDVVYAMEEPPAWHNMVLIGTGREGEIWFQPMWPETKRLYALLLTNNAIARSLCGVEDAGRYAAYVAETAVSYFSEARDEKEDHSRWEAAALIVQARQATDQRAQAYYASYALQLLGSRPDTGELQAYARYLAGMGDGKVYDPGAFGTRIGRRSRLASLGVNDLFRFNR